ncbi:MAG: alanyl-tRNA editing protein [bacterium]|nr:alanyl-tRNA editing protein [bacterium]
MTHTLFMEDCYLKEFEAEVTSIEGNKVELDKTAFYPESGGQPTDKGKLICGDTEYAVNFVRKDKGRIIHELDKEGLQNGDKVKGVLDWERRYLFMRYHTACHVLSGIVSKETNAQITGNQIAEDKARIDFNLENFDRELIKSYEEKSNAIIKEGKLVDLNFMPREEAMKIPSIVKLAMGLPESIKTIRVVDITNFDKQACGGSHVKNTSEIKGIEIIGAENKGKSNRRIYFKLRESI